MKVRPIYAAYEAPATHELTEVCKWFREGRLHPHIVRVAPVELQPLFDVVTYHNGRDSSACPIAKGLTLDAALKRASRDRLDNAARARWGWRTVVRAAR